MKKRSDLTKIVIIYNVVFVLLAVIFYFITPTILGYPPNSINNEFERTIDSGINYYKQYFMSLAGVMIVANIFIYFNIKGIKNWKQIFENDQIKKLTDIKRRCFTMPYKIYLIQILIPSIIVTLVMASTGTTPELILKTVILIFTFSILLSLITYIFSKQVCNKILINIHNVEICDKIVRFNFRSRLILQFVPLLIVAIIFPATICYSRLAEERGELIFEQYREKLSKAQVQEFDDYYELENFTSKITKRLEEDSIFIISEDRKVLYFDNQKPSEFFIKYLFEVSTNGHSFDYYGSEGQGVAVEIEINNEKYYIGFLYGTFSGSGMIGLAISILAVMLLCLMFLSYFSKDITKDISIVTDYLTKLSKQTKIEYDQKLAVTSNDEIGDLVIAFNQILDLEKNNIEILKSHQEIMVEQERLSSLGQLIGGIAHNLKTPIMSIAGAIEGLTDLIKEYDESIEDKNVTAEDHHDIAKEMSEWAEKIRPYLSYMTEVIDTVKGQAVSMSASTMKSFTAKELMLRTQILLRDELKRRHCKLDIDIKVDEKAQIAGEISAIVQVIDNLIINAMDAYKEEGGDIFIEGTETESMICLKITDNAGGIPAKVQDRLFKEMVTSKGKNGTGLGLYMSYSTIKGKFNGNLYYETQEGVGTTFVIEIPKYLGAIEE